MGKSKAQPQGLRVKGGGGEGMGWRRVLYQAQSGTYCSMTILIVIVVVLKDKLR